jgi:hypothetical protein
MVRPSRGIILCHLDAGKYSNLDKIGLPESPFAKMTYHVRGCMAFRSNELGSSWIMAYFFRTRPYRTRVWPLGWWGMPRKTIFVSSHKNCFFHFQSGKMGFFVRQLPKWLIKSWEQHLVEDVAIWQGLASAPPQHFPTLAYVWVSTHKIFNFNGSGYMATWVGHTSKK